MSATQSVVAVFGPCDDRRRADPASPVRVRAQVVPDDELSDSDLILPAADSTLVDVRQLLSSSDQGLIPG